MIHQVTVVFLAFDNSHLCYTTPKLSAPTAKNHE